MIHFNGSAHSHAKYYFFEGLGTTVKYINLKKDENGRSEPTFDPIVGMERIDSKQERLVE